MIFRDIGGNAGKSGGKLWTVKCLFLLKNSVILRIYRMVSVIPVTSTIKFLTIEIP